MANNRREKKEEVKNNAYNRAQIRLHLENYVVNTIKGNLYLSRCNMLGKQVADEKANELIDGVTKSLDYVYYEFLLSKHSATKCFANAWVSKQELFKLDVSSEVIDKYYSDYANAPSIRSDYSGIEMPSEVAGFVNEK
jgi:hypothetical protein